MPGAPWQAERWFVPVPKLHYDSKDTPKLVIEVETYLVASAFVRAQEFRTMTLAGLIGKPELINIPMVYLNVFLEEDLDNLTIVSRDTRYTAWEIPGIKPVQLPNDFIDELTDRLCLKACWNSEDILLIRGTLK